MKLDLYYSDDRENSVEDYEEMFSLIANAVLKDFADKNYELSVSLVNNETIHNFNKQYRNIDRPTDVLSFAFLEADDLELEGVPTNLGDIIICYDIAKEQAVNYGHSERREFAFLFTHGLLHLLGYDHMKEEDEKVMFAKQEEYLDKLDIKR